MNSYLLKCVWLLPCYSLMVLADPVPAELDGLFTQAVTSATVPGISVAVADSHGVQWAKGYGFADLEQQLPMQPQDKLRIGSVAKVITTAGLMRLYQRGKVDLDLPVTDYVPSWPADKAVTLRQLTSHSAGVRHYKEGADEFLLNRHFDSVTASLALFRDDPLLFAPGTAEHYSTFGWTLVSAAMEGADNNSAAKNRTDKTGADRKNASARDFQQIIVDEVFTPLALQESAFDEPSKLIPYRVRPYSVRDGKLINSPQTDHSYKWAGGGFIASAEDVSRFAVAQLDEHYLSAATQQLMFSRAQLSNGGRSHFGVGWLIGFDDYRQRKKYRDNAEALALMDSVPLAVMHSGGSMGGTTMTILCREHHRAVTVVKNVDGDDSADVFLLALRTLHYYHQREPLGKLPPQ